MAEGLAEFPLLPDRVVMATDQRQSPASHPVQALAPLFQATLPTKVIMTSTP